MPKMFPAEAEICQLVGKFIDYKLSIIKGNDITLSREEKISILPWTEQLQDEAKELVHLLKKRSNRDLCWCDGDEVCAEFAAGKLCKEIA